MSSVERLQEQLTSKAAMLGTEPYLINRAVRPTGLGRSDRTGVA
jgi:hypothetical protein